MATVGVIGSGAWGTALAQVCARAGLAVTLQSHDPHVAETLAATRENRLYLPGVRIDDAVRPTAHLADLARADMVLGVAPAQHMRAVLTAFAPHVRPGLPIVLCAKGVEQGSGMLMTQVLAEVAPQGRPVVLSGPGFAGEVARGLPCALTLACPDPELGQTIASAIATPVFRPYLTGDLTGAEVGGAVKNVLAIACGIVEGRGLGRSAHAGLVTRGLAEMTRIAVALGGRAETLAGLSGLGDLVLTCSSPQSRNMSVGLALGRGETLADSLAGKVSVAEGVATAPTLRTLTARLGVDAPVCKAVAAIVAGEVTVEMAIEALLSRPLRPE